MKSFISLSVVFIVSTICFFEAESRDIKFTNRCSQTIWINPKSNPEFQDLPGGIVKLAKGKSFTYKIPANGWGGRFWPKSGCNSTGQGCEVGQSVDPCNEGGCDPPAETKVEFYFHKSGQESTWYDISLVDGYSLPVEIVPSVQQGSCKTTKCALSLNSCPTKENDVGNLQVVKKGKVVQCLSPCKRWNYPAPWGMGRSENEKPGELLCCPTPPVSVEECRAGPVVKTQYVKLIRNSCPTAYSYAYDDEEGLHVCPNEVNFNVKFCP